MPVLVKIKRTDAINPFEDVRAKECLHCLAQPVLTCQHDVERFKHDTNFVQVHVVQPCGSPSAVQAPPGTPKKPDPGARTPRTLTRLGCPASALCTHVREGDLASQLIN